MSQLQTQILHQDYLLTCPDGQEAQLLEAVERVDQQFQQMRDTTKLRSRERICVLLSVNLSFENLELRQQLQTLQQQLAAAQGAPLSDPDAERLQALEMQATHDQALASQLQARLDQVLLGGAFCDKVPTDEVTYVQDPTSDRGQTTETELNTEELGNNLNNAEHEDLPPSSAESL